MNDQYTPAFAKFKDDSDTVIKTCNKEARDCMLCNVISVQTSAL